MAITNRGKSDHLGEATMLTGIIVTTQNLEAGLGIIAVGAVINAIEKANLSTPPETRSKNQKESEKPRLRG